MSNSVDGDVERIVLAPGIERVNTTVRIIENDKRRVRRVVTLFTIWNLLLVVAPVSLLIHTLVQGGDGELQFSAMLLVFCLVVWVGIMCSFFGNKEYMKQKDTVDYNTVSFPTDYFEAVVKRTVHGAKYDLTLSEEGEVNVPESIKKLVSAHDVSDKVASFVQQKGERIVFTYNDWHESLQLNPGRTFDTKTKTPLFFYHGRFLPECDEYVVTINNEVLPHNGKHYFLPDTLLTTNELFTCEK